MRAHFGSSIAVGLVVIVSTLALAASSSAQTGDWTSTDIGAVTLAGSATETNGVWTVSGDGSDIWGTADSFQFLHRGTITGIVTARIDDMQNTDTFAKAGVMFRTSLSAGAATAILDVRPTGQVEFMGRSSDGAPMQFIATTTVTLPAWLRLQTSRDGVTASVSQDGFTWSIVSQNVPVLRAGQFQAGVAVTSHNSGQLNTVHVSHLTTDVVQSGWRITDIGDVGVSGPAGGNNGTWVLNAGGSDIWGTADAFMFLYRHALDTNQHLRVHVESLQNTNPFAKAGLMLRQGLEPDAPTVILDVKPDGGVEFMQRNTWGGSMQYLSGAAVTLPAWLDLSWQTIPGPGGASIVSAAVSQDKVTWTTLAGQATFNTAAVYEVGLAVTSHDTAHLAQAIVRGLSLTPVDAASDDIGAVGQIGNATTDITSPSSTLIVQGAGTDIWGTADSFEFVHGGADAPGGSLSIFSQVSFDQNTVTSTLAKAGLMFRDGLGPSAAQVILDVKPDGGIEFMARLCTGCATTFIAGATTVFPAFITLKRNGATFEAIVATQVGMQSLGTVDVPMAAPTFGYAVTSHDADANRITQATFTLPAE